LTGIKELSFLPNYLLFPIDGHLSAKHYKP
jgi:hypothetical protein